MRATEGTILERIPPRVKVREQASLELPHILILVDDEKKELIEPLHKIAPQREKLYDFDLMMGGGHITGYLLNEEDYQSMAEKIAALGTREVFDAKYGVSGYAPLVFAVGDGNHSLATAKACYENLKTKIGDEAAKQSPARYALVELNNLHDDSLQFEAIHRAVFDVDHEKFCLGLAQYCANCHGEQGVQTFTVLCDGTQKEYIIPTAEHTLTIGSVQHYIDAYLKENGGRVDYIHGEEVVASLAKQGAVGILVPCMQKSDLFKTVILEGALPRKTFSMGEACEKRYYLEARKIK